MRKLNQRKVRWIIKEINSQERSIYRIAKLQDITPQWTRQLYQYYQESSEYPYPKKSGRKPSPISDEEKRIVLEAYHNHPLAAVTLEKILADQDVHIGHNRIHRILKEAGLAKDEPHKQRRRSYVRYERRFSNAGMQIGLKNRINRSSSSRMMPPGSSLDMASTEMPHLRMQHMFSYKLFKHTVFPNKS